MSVMYVAKNGISHPQTCNSHAHKKNQDCRILKLAANPVIKYHI